MSETVTKSPVAIIGMGCVLPDAPDVETFWDNLLQAKNSIREVAAERWDPALYWSDDRHAEDKTYAKIGAFVQDDAFDGVQYRMPPKVVDQIDPCQRWALSAARQALLDAGLATGLRGDDGKPFDRERTAVIVGNAMGGELSKTETKRVVWAEARAAIQADTDFQALPADKQAAILERAEARYKSGTNPITEDTMPGHLSNVVAGRIANVFDLSGKNFTTDAACASSLAALDAAVDTLRKDEADLVVWGGSDRSMDVSAYIQFSKIGALSADGSRPFDKDANGFVMGEGCAMFVLKRLEDAERDGDRIYGVVRGIGGSSDGKGKGITAPNPAGQVKAVRRAYDDAGVPPASIGYLEAHGTSTPVGDPVELESVMTAFSESGDVPQGSIRVGSVKSNIGHLKAAAGAAGLLKATLAVHHGVIPPSINVRELNPRIDWGNSPFQVATERTEWPQSGDAPRRAAVSSFGFGGTNFHVVIEQYLPGRITVEDPRATAQTVDVGTRTELDVPALREHMAEAAHLEGEALVLADTDVPKALGLEAPTFSETGQGARLRDALHPLTAAGILADRRVGFHVDDVADIPKRLAMAEKAMTDPAAARLAFNQGIFLGAGAHEGKVAFLFPGQGTQYVNMGRELARKYQIVADTFAEADEVLQEEIGAKLTDILWPAPDTDENRKASEEKLKLTEFTQPAVLAMDTAILRLLDSWGVKPDVVAGHSLGEYGALVAAGVLSFPDALHAVAARGREMAHVEVPDLGKMASVSADWHQVQDAIADIDGYVICANKNCPSQTVIAGSSDGVDAAVEKLQAEGIQCMMLPVSAAFHSDIVAPASKPLRNVLERLDVRAPKVDVITNVGAVDLPTDPAAIRDNLAVQVASPVEWIGTIERMYEMGVRSFIEVGPKRALSGFVADILKDKDDARPVFANHPKKGDIQSINELFAYLGASGLRPALPDLGADIYTATLCDPGAAFQRDVEVADQVATATPPGPPGHDPRIDVIARHLSDLTTELDRIRGRSPTPHTGSLQATDGRFEALGLCADDIGIAGISVGLPGTQKALFDEGDWDRILAGENLITPLSEQDRGAMVEKNIVRLVKSAGGQGTFQSIQDVAEVIHLAARRGRFDLREWGVGDDLIEVLDKTSQYALAAGLEALKDAGIPLQRTYIETSTGSMLPKDWRLPAPLREDTGIIFASAFPGYDNLIGELSRHLADRYAGRSLDDLQALYGELLGVVEDDDLRARLQDAFDAEFARLQDVLPDHGAARYEFNRKFLFAVLSMGHAQLAQFLGARGPNTQLNAACASTTQAIAIAEDWIRTGRARRVIVVGADDATSDNMMEWIGSGFLASGAATTKADVTEAALPFDARRHGMIIGMGAVGVIVEAVPETEARGMRPIARLLATQVSNSAFHGSRLDVDHIAGQMQKVVSKGLRAKALASGDRPGLTPEAVAASTVFMSHETYTPARGGSAAAEIHALRATFGPAADKVVVANTKGFTGHPQGAGIEDAVVLKCLQRGTVPPIPNLRRPDPELGSLNLSKGGSYDVRYALRLAAGFGSQVAMTFTELVAREDERVADATRYAAWLAEVSGMPGAATEVVDRTLRIVDQGVPEPAATVEVATKPLEPATKEQTPIATKDDALERVTAIVADKTGYPLELLEPDLDLEADLGIDTVKQAELFGELRELFGVPLNEDLKIADYNTLRKVASYMGGEGSPSEPAPGPTEALPTETVAPPVSAGPAGANDAALAKVTSVVAEKTGYPVDLLEPDLDLEADLGIDTVKQAELFGELRELFGVPLNEDLKIADYNTLRKVASYMGGDASPNEPATQTEGAAEAATPVASEGPGEASEEALSKVTAVVADKTGYPVDLLEPDLDLEADLGIDTVKQAELFGELRELFGVPLNEDLKIADYNTLRKVAAYMGGEGTQAEAPVSTPASDPATPQPESTPAPIHRYRPLRRMMRLPDEPNDLPTAGAAFIGDVPGRLRSEFGNGPVEALVCWATSPGHGVTPADVFDAAKEHVDTLRLVVVVTAQDGAHGLGAPRDATMAGLAGIGKALRKELPEAVVKVIDLHPDLADPDLVLAEIRRGGTRTEVCYDDDATRYVIDVAPEPLQSPALDLSGATLLVTGGGQGITAEMLAAVAVPGARFALLGRTALPAEASTWAGWSEDEWKAEEGRAIEALRAAGEKPTPVNVRKRVDAKRKAAEVHDNLERLRGAGAEAEYWSCDVMDADSVAAVVAAAKQCFGSIDGIVHAAGVEISKMLADKPRGQFDLVYSVKVAGLENVLAATEGEPLRYLVGFGSVAGRFGNVGQTDYSAANEAMAKRITQAAHERDIETAFTIAWGPWGEVGMATRGGIMTVLEASGVTPITTEGGVSAWKAELGTKGVREVVVCGEIGALDADGQVRAEPSRPSPGDTGPGQTTSDARPIEVPAGLRLLDEITTASDSRVVARISMDKARDAYPGDHALDGVPLLPGVFGIEAFAQAASLLAPDGTVCVGATDVRFSAPLKQHKDRPAQAIVEAELLGNGDGVRVGCRLLSRFTGPDGKEHGDPRIHFEATMRFDAPPNALRTDEVPDCDATITRDRIYPPFFHGPSFQVLEAAGPIDTDEAVARGQDPEVAPLDGEATWLTAPLVTEALFQLCGLYTLETESIMSLPAGIDRIDIYDPRARPGGLSLWCSYDGQAEGRRIFDAAACTDDGDVAVRLVGYRMGDVGPIATPKAEQQDRPQEPDAAPAVTMTPPPRDVDLQLPDLDGMVLASVPVPTGPPVDHPDLTDRERQQVAGFAAPKRACEWAAGRLAMKAAARRAAPELGALDVTVDQDPGSGAPILMVRGQRSPAKCSITHSNGAAIAAIADDVVGIDLERVEERPGPWWNQAFSGDEIDGIRAQADADLASTCAWAAKEACLKRAGTGLRASLHDLKVRLAGEGATVRGPWGDWSVRFFQIDDLVLAVTAPTLDTVATTHDR